MNCLSQIIKYIVYLLNVVFVAGGILLIVVGSIAVSNRGPSDSLTIPICILVIGCVIFVVSFLGCCGTIRENPCCTKIYAILMLILFVLQLTLTICMFVQRNKQGNSNKNADISCWSSLVISLFEFSLVIISCCLARAMKKRNENCNLSSEP